jgi:tellurite resistance protein TerC
VIWIWVGFIVFVVTMLALDLGVFHRKAHAIGMKEALAWSAFWISLGLSFSVFIYFAYDNHWMGLGTKPDAVDGVNAVPNDARHATAKYLTGFVIEQSLSVDNLFVILMILTFFRVPAMYQHRVLFWGILGALVMRGVMIGLGATLINRYHWILYVFGGFLIITAVKMLISGDDADEANDPSQSWVVRMVRRFFPVTHNFHGASFLVRAGSQRSHQAPTPGAEVAPDPVVDSAKPGTILLTPLMLVLILVEFTDLIFAVDSIPAIFAITADPFLVFTSNVFAILGLRSLYFALAGMMDKFRYLKVSLAVVLFVVGGKMLAAKWLKAWIGENFNFWLLAVVLGILAVGVVLSMMKNKSDERKAAAAGEGAPQP